jgi:hypothetical protein
MIAHGISVADMELFQGFNKDLPYRSATALRRANAIQIRIAICINKNAKMQKMYQFSYSINSAN